MLQATRKTTSRIEGKTCQPIAHMTQHTKYLAKKMLQPRLGPGRRAKETRTESQASPE